MDNAQLPMATMTSVDRYRTTILEMWDAIKLNEASVRTLYLQVSPALEGGIPPEAITATAEEMSSATTLISLVCGLWEELEPKVKGKTCEADFNSYERYYNEPKELQKNTTVLFKMVRMLRGVLEELQITKIEQEVR